MSRKIKFRAWLKKEYFSVLNPENKIYDVENLDFDKQQAYLAECGWFDFEDIELMQYTGIKDKNDVEIYEGDIIEYWYRSVSGTASSTAIVKFYDGAFQLEDIDDSDSAELLFLAEDLEVVGNVWDNPELLEVQDDDDDDDDEFWKVLETLDTIED